MGEVDDIASLSTDCLTEALSSSDDDSTWESLEPSKCPQAFVDGGFASQEEEVDGDVACYAASQPQWTSRAKLSWRMTKSGRRRARRVGSGSTLSSLPTTPYKKRRHVMLSVR
eukprot:2906263-Amphidinium_carterae.2